MAPRPAPAATLTELQAQLDAFTSIYNTQRPHRSLAHRATPATAYAARPKAAPGDRGADTHDRVRTDIIGTTGTVTLRTGGKLYHIGVGRTHAGTHVIMLVQDLHIRIINAATGELLRQLSLDPSRNYQPAGRRPGPTTRTRRTRSNPNPDVGSGCPQ
jgi:Integrase core domain